jgi:adenosylhomocysteine nucleosidase
MAWKSLSVATCCVLTIILVGCQTIPKLKTATIDTEPRLAIISAFKPELEKLYAEAIVTDTYVINGRSYYVGQLAGNDVVLALSGISMINAAMTTQTLHDRFSVSGIIFSGIAGGVNPDLNIGDVVVPAEWAQYQEQLYARESEDGWDTGWFSNEFGHFGMMFPQKVFVTRKNGETDVEEPHFWFQADTAMVRVARKIAQDVNLYKHTSNGDSLTSDPRVIVGGKGVSGQTFVDNAPYRDWVWETFRADALDMETAAVAHVAYVNGIPFIAFRSLSDLAGGGPGENELPTFFQLAADNSAKVVISFLKEWANQ